MRALPCINKFNSQGQVEKRKRVDPSPWVSNKSVRKVDGACFCPFFNIYINELIYIF